MAKLPPCPSCGGMHASDDTTVAVAAAAAAPPCVHAPPLAPPAPAPTAPPPSAAVAAAGEAPPPPPLPRALRNAVVLHTAAQSSPFPTSAAEPQPAWLVLYERDFRVRVGSGAPLWFLVPGSGFVVGARADALPRGASLQLRVVATSQPSTGTTWCSATGLHAEVTAAHLPPCLSVGKADLAVKAVSALGNRDAAAKLRALGAFFIQKQEPGGSTPHFTHLVITAVPTAAAALCCRVAAADAATGAPFAADAEPFLFDASHDVTVTVTKVAWFACDTAVGAPPRWRCLDGSERDGDLDDAAPRA